MSYGPKTDPIIYGPLTNGFTEEDWIALARAALDQAPPSTAIRCALEHLEPESNPA